MISHFTTQKPQVILSHCIQAQHCSEAVPSRVRIADPWLATNLQHHSIGRDRRRRDRVHFKHTYPSQKANECFSKGRRKLFYGSLAPPHPLKLECTENAFPHGGRVYGWKGVNTSTYRQVCEYIINVSFTVMPACFSISPALLTVRSPCTNSPCSSVTADCLVL